MADKMDIVILGATGFTGMHCIPVIHKLAKSDGRSLKWGVAARSESKLKQVLENMSKKVGDDLSIVPIIICNVEDEESLFQMAQKTKLVINCVGPYVLYGERVVDACIKAGTHHIDVSGEPQYMENMQLKKNESAKEKGVYIISACGFDSIPCDLGTVFVDQNFGGTLNSIVTYLEFWVEGNHPKPLINYGTYETIIHNISTVEQLKNIRRSLFPNKFPVFKPKLESKKLPHKSNIVDGWVLPFPGADRSVMRRTQQYLYGIENKRPVQTDTLIVVKSFFQLIMMTIMALTILLLAQFKFGKKILLNYPEVITYGIFSKTQPSEETTENSWFQITFYGEGWKDKLPEKDYEYSKPCDTKIVGRVKGRNPGYGSTCICLVAAAIAVLTEKDKLAGAGKGGVYTPGAAFAKTSLVKMLHENGVTFDIISKTDLKE